MSKRAVWKRNFQGHPIQTMSRCLAVASWLALSAALTSGCGVEERSHAARTENSPTTDVYAWPEKPSAIATLDLKERGQIRIALYAQLAPNNVTSFTELADSGFYDGVTFHRVIRNFMIQTGDPLSRDDDPGNDGKGGLTPARKDEISDAPFVRGVVAVANAGRPDSGGSQFFIMHKERRGLDGRYTILGRVVAGIHLVDDVAVAETDEGGRWGPANRPLENIVVERVRIEYPQPGASEGTAMADAGS